MKLLFDHNLSHRLIKRLADLFPDSSHTSLLNFSAANDLTIWEYAKNNDYVIVTLDKDFADLVLQRSIPPKVIWLRCGNSSVEKLSTYCGPTMVILKFLKRFQMLKFWRFGPDFHVSPF